MASDSGVQREELSNQLVSAVGEAFNNAVLHAYAGRAAGEVEIVTTFDDERIVVDVVDFGASFAPDQVPSPDLGALPTSGMGLYIIRSFVDRLEYLPGRPNILRLTKVLRRVSYEPPWPNP
jgi:serine/threonine-protein kinase RsbW